MSREEDALVDEQNLARFCQKVVDLARKEFGTDSGGDPKIELILVDRSRCERLHYWPVPCNHNAVTDAQKQNIRRTIELNWRIASDALRISQDLARYSEAEASEKAKKKPEEK